MLTVLPLPSRDGRGAAAAPAWFGLVGALVGGVAATVDAVTQPVLGSTVAATLAVATLVALTGGLHQDGLADCADAMGVRGDRGRRLDVMREPTIGTYGALALILWALLLIASLAALPSHDVVPALVCAASAARFGALLHARWTPTARRDGLGAAFAPSWPAVAVAGVTASAVAILAVDERAVVVLLAAALAAAAVSAWSRRVLGGRSGDTLGAAVVLAEVAVVLVLLGTTQAP